MIGVLGYLPTVSKYVTENFSPRSFRDSNSKYLYDGQYQPVFDSAKIYGMARNSNYPQSNSSQLLNRNSAWEASSTFSPSSNSRRKLDLGG